MNLERLKNFGEACKNIVIYVLTPFAFVLGYFFYLSSKNRNLRDELLSKEGDEKLNELKGEQKKDDAAAGAAVDAYEKLRASYLRQSNNSVRQGPGCAEGTDSDQGPENHPGGDAA